MVTEVYNNGYLNKFLSELGKSPTPKESNVTSLQLEVNGQKVTFNIANTNPDGGGGANMAGKQSLALSPEARIMNVLDIKDEKALQSLLTILQTQGITGINVENGQIKTVEKDGKTVKVKGDFFKALLKMLETENLSNSGNLEDSMYQTINQSLNEPENPINLRYWEVYLDSMKVIMEVQHDAVENFVKSMEESHEKMVANLKFLSKLATKKAQEKKVLEKLANKKQNLEDIQKDIMNIKLLMQALVKNRVNSGCKLNEVLAQIIPQGIIGISDGSIAKLLSFVNTETSLQDKEGKLLLNEDALQKIDDLLNSEEVPAEEKEKIKGMLNTVKDIVDSIDLEDLIKIIKENANNTTKQSPESSKANPATDSTYDNAIRNSLNIEIKYAQH